MFFQRRNRAAVRCQFEKVKSTRIAGSETAIVQAASESAGTEREASYIAKEMRKLELGDREKRLKERLE